jgi:hypothetical protein
VYLIHFCWVYFFFHHNDKTGHFRSVSIFGFLCILYNQRDATYTTFFIIISALYVSGGFSAHHQELIKLPLVDSRKAYNTQGCTYSFISPWWWAGKPPETCRALIIMKNIV